ncbi:hypothetical protein Cgig2_013073 [Carnegiea gigantea]|uniref:Helicase CHR10 n=1 Tax=Carnegiea gigantea TaxID=171969 RepID=A0A9Q1KML0_9CARY|nr:hypothetical protein Cgig2_013073 [Carnegiea gigantea]
MSRSYEQRLKAAAKIILLSDSSVSDDEPPLFRPEKIGVTATLKPHQFEGVSWLIRRYLLGVNVILDGTWENFASCHFLELLESLSKIAGTIFWMSEIEKFSPKLRVLGYMGEKEHRRMLRRTIHEHVQAQSVSNDVSLFPFDVLLTTYDIALIDQDFLSQFPWQYAVIDEAQRLKNPSSVLYGVLKERYLMPRRLLMTGTPIQNNLTELWALMHFCMPSVFGTLEQFIHAFNAVGNSSKGHYDAEVKEQMNTLKCILRAFMLRRTKSKLIECGTLVLPPLTEITMMVPLVTLQKSLYMSILRKELPKLLALTSATSSVQSLQNIVIQLRKACSHPYLFPGIEPEPYEEGEHLVQDYLELRHYTYERLDGSVRAEERFAAIRSFSRQSNSGNMDSESNGHGAFVFLISTRAGGVIFYEQDWNPQVDRQALQRAHRIGQMNPVLSISLVTGRTIEEVRMYEHVGNELSGAEPGDLRSMIYGLRLFDPEGKEKSSEPNMSELNAMAEKVLGQRYAQKSDSATGEIESRAIRLGEYGVGMEEANTSVGPDPDLDEASYRSWVEKFKDIAEKTDKSSFELESRRISSEEKQQRMEAARKKAEEKKLAKWQTLGYQSLAIPDPPLPSDCDLMSVHGSVNFVLGDCTRPSDVCPSLPAIIYSCVDDSGKWGHGGLFDALARLSSKVPEAYERASEFGDLHQGDLHLIQLDDDHNARLPDGQTPQWVALAVVQSYNPRRKVPRTGISISDLERCVAKASFAAAQNSAAIHMPRIGYQDGSDRAVWYSTERLLRTITKGLEGKTGGSNCKFGISYAAIDEDGRTSWWFILAFKNMLKVFFHAMI